jgi:hypothetical protein
MNDDRVHGRSARWIFAAIFWLAMIVLAIVETYWRELIPPFYGISLIFMLWFVPILLWVLADSEHYGLEKKRRELHAVISAISMGLWVPIYLVLSRGWKRGVMSFCWIFLGFLLVNLVVLVVADQFPMR